MEPPEICHVCKDPETKNLDDKVLGWTECRLPGCPMKQFLQHKPFSPIFMIQDFTLPDRSKSEATPYAIFDLDGVLCLFSPLRKEWYDHGLYNDVNSQGCKEPMISAMVTLSQSLALVGVEIFICTSRDAAYAGDTIMQLQEGGVQFRALLMRGKGDHKSSSQQLKEEMWSIIQMQFPAWNCILAIDDRPDIVKLYKRLGLNGVIFPQPSKQEN